MILALKTDNPEAELYLHDGKQVIAQKKWQAHRALSETLLDVCDEVCAAAGKSLEDLTGLVVYQGPGSFTGLRIGITMMNTLAYTKNIPITGSAGETWLDDGMAELPAAKRQLILPHYGSPVNITKPRK
jgi:tRNA threonylcarbamoyladenosine biosynthesis protein TsaB